MSELHRFTEDYPTEVLDDLIGARVVVWFLSDVYGMLAAIRGSHRFKLPFSPRSGSLNSTGGTILDLSLKEEQPDDGLHRCHTTGSYLGAYR
jgi:hypothetical protein